MATIEINRKTHRALRTFGTLESRMEQATSEINRMAEPAKWDVMSEYLVELSQGVEEAKFLALVSDYLLSVQRDRAQLRQENDLLRDELSYVRSKMIRAEEKIVTMEEDQRNSEFSRQMARYDAALSGDIDFETVMDGGDDWMVNENDNSQSDDDDEAEETLKHNALFDSLFTRSDSVDTSDFAAEFGNETGGIDAESSRCDPVIEHEMTFRTKTAMKYFAKYLNEGRFDIAEPLCHAMIAELQDCNDSNKRDLAVALEILAMTERENQRYSEAAENLKLALEIYEETLDTDHPIIVATLNNLAHIYGKCDQYDQAEPLCERALQIRQTRPEYQPRDVARQHNNMAIIHQQRSSYNSAIRHYRKAINIYATQEESSDTIVASEKVKRRMASAMCHLNQFEEAGAVYKDILTPKHKEAKLLLPQRPIWEVAEEVERMSASQRKQSVDSYKLQYDYRDWYDSIQVYLPNAFSSLKKLAFVYRKMNMHNAAKMLEHLVTITDRKKMRLKFAPPRVDLSPQSFAASRAAAARKAAEAAATSSSASSSDSTGSINQNERSV